MRVLGIDIASSRWASNGSALLMFDPGAYRFGQVLMPAIAWPRAQELTPVSLADAIDTFAREHRVVAVALDGPQGWRDPETPVDLPGVGRRCEHECSTQAKTGTYPRVYPGTQLAWVEFSTRLFESLLTKPGVTLAGLGPAFPALEHGYVLLEAFPTSAWRTSGLQPLPGKNARPDVQPFMSALFSRYGISRDLQQICTHDDLQAVVAAVAAAAFVGGPAEALRRGVAAKRDDNGRILEGFIWDVRPLRESAMQEPRMNTTGNKESTDSSEVHIAGAGASAGMDSSKRAVSRSHSKREALLTAVRVTSGVMRQVDRLGKSQAQITVRGLPHGSKERRVNVAFSIDNTVYQLVIGDSHAAWASHQDPSTDASFHHLFERLARSVNEWTPVQAILRIG